MQNVLGFKEVIRILSCILFSKHKRLGHSSTSYLCPLMEGYPQQGLSSPINSGLLLGNKSCGFGEGLELKIGKVHSLHFSLEKPRITGSSATAANINVS